MLFLFFSTLSLLVFQPWWATDHTATSVHLLQSGEYKWHLTRGSSDLQGGQTTCYCDWNPRIMSSTKWCLQSFFETAVPRKILNYKLGKLNEGPNWSVVVNSLSDLQSLERGDLWHETLHHGQQQPEASHELNTQPTWASKERKHDKAKMAQFNL